MSRIFFLAVLVLGVCAQAFGKEDHPDELRLTAPAMLIEQEGKLHQPIRVQLSASERAREVVVTAKEEPTLSQAMAAKAKQTQLLWPAVERETQLSIQIKQDGNVTQSGTLTLRPVRKWVVYILPHSHVDIGYTQLQSEVEIKQVQNLQKALDLIDLSAKNPPEAQFKWNTEGVWAVESFLKQATPEEQLRLLTAIQNGKMELGAMYANELTGLCRPEELLHLMQPAQRIARRAHAKLEAAMISDVPGCTWGTVSALSAAGVKYFSIGPNYFDRIGRLMKTWEDRPFYWEGPDSHEKVLCWVPYMGYALGHTKFRFDEQLLDCLNKLESKGYPYDITHLRWTVGGDNGPPDGTLAEVVKKWNAEHAFPKLVIATTSQAFQAFETRYRDQIPVFRGDLTPYWEDGAGSSARETAMNRTASEQLTQAETLWGMVPRSPFPNLGFISAWREVLLYNEHTWGAHNSVHEPDAPFVKEQWNVKEGFAQMAFALAQDFHNGANHFSSESRLDNLVDVFNTSSWPRTELFLIYSANNRNDLSRVLDAKGQPVPSQRLQDGTLAVLAQDVPPLAGVRYQLVKGEPLSSGPVHADATSLSSQELTVRVNPQTGAIESLRCAGLPDELCDAASGEGLNQYHYLIGEDLKNLESNGPVKITVQETGPLVASLLVESSAPGCASLKREIRIVAGVPRVELINHVDKLAVRKKEGVHFGFAFHVPEGKIRIDIPWGQMQPERDQLPGSCKNWFTVGRWVDVSNEAYGVTWGTIDAPLVEVGEISAKIIESQGHPEAWREQVAATQRFYSWVMNNHWHTNYRAEQSGPTTFRYVLEPHAAFDPVAAQRFGIECSQPLVVGQAIGPEPTAEPLLELDSPLVQVSSVKPSEDEHALIVRLFAGAGQACCTNLKWRQPPKQVVFSDLEELPGEAVTGPIRLRPWQVVTLRAELK